MRDLPKQFFAACVDDFIKASNDLPAVSASVIDSTISTNLRRAIGTDGTAHLRRLAADPRAAGIWKAFHGDKQAVENFLVVVTFALIELGSVEDARKVRDKLVPEYRKLESALFTIESYCARFREIQRLLDMPSAAVLHLPEGLENQLEILRAFAKHVALYKEATITPLLPGSRKVRSDFLVRVHLAWLLVRKMVDHFRRPHFQMVADTINVSFNHSEAEEVTADSVRDAWRRHELGKRRKARVREGSAAPKRAIRRA